MCLAPHKLDSIGANITDTGLELLALRDDGQIFKIPVTLGIIDSREVKNAIEILDSQRKRKSNNDPSRSSKNLSCNE